MKFRIVAFAVAAAILSFTAATPALASPAAAGLPVKHKPAPPQVNGRQLAAALLPAGDFGSGFVFGASEDTGKKLLSTKHPGHVSSLSCYNFYNNQITGGVGNTAGAASRYTNPSPSDSGYPATIFWGFQDVLQFSTSASAKAYFGQEQAKYSACTSFLIPNPGSSPYLVSLTGVTRTTVDGDSAFWVTAEAGGGIAYLNVLCVVANTDTYSFWQIAATENEPSVALMTSLLHRVHALYPRAG
jgi:hypothetical protein